MLAQEAQQACADTNRTEVFCCCTKFESLTRAVDRAIQEIHQRRVKNQKLGTNNKIDEDCQSFHQSNLELFWLSVSTLDK
jgi:hypothetical protein